MDGSVRGRCGRGSLPGVVEERQGNFMVFEAMIAAWVDIIQPEDWPLTGHFCLRPLWHAVRYSVCQPTGLINALLRRGAGELAWLLYDLSVCAVRTINGAPCLTLWHCR